MIHNDDELMVVRKQLRRIEDALAALRHEVLPKNQRNYEILSEGYVEQIAMLRAEIDAYLGVGADPVLTRADDAKQPFNPPAIDQDPGPVQT